MLWPLLAILAFTVTAFCAVVILLIREERQWERKEGIRTNQGRKLVPPRSPERKRRGW